jgi:tricorn protease
MWLGETVFFRSDRNGEFNVFAYDTKSKQVRQVTKHDDFPVLSASSGGGRIVYEQAGVLHVLDPQSGASRRLTIAVASDVRETRARFARGARWIREAALSPTGMRAVFNFRGEIVTLPGEKGDVRNLTNTVAAHERFPAWSPDGRSIAWFSDATGEYQLYVAAQDGKGQPRAIKVAGEGFYRTPVWSPDSQKIAYFDNSLSVYWLDVKSGTSKKIASQPIYSPVIIISCAWSPDSKWLAYAMDNQAGITTVYAHSTEQTKTFQVSDGLSDVSNPVFDKSGKYLFFFASTDAGLGRTGSRSPTPTCARPPAFTLRCCATICRPDCQESDEEKPAQKRPAPEGAKKTEKPEGAKDRQPQGPGRPRRGAEKGAAVPAADGTASHRLPSARRSINLQTGTAGHIYYQTTDGATALNRFDLNTGRPRCCCRRRPLRRVAGRQEAAVPERHRVVDRADGEADPGVGWADRRRLDRGARRSHGRVEADLRRGLAHQPRLLLRPEHARRGLGEAARHVRRVPAARRDPRGSQPRAAVDVERTVGHHNVGGGDSLTEPRTVPGGLLGADFEIANSRYRLKKVYGGLNWNPQMRAPLTEPGVNAKAGEYLLAVNGRDLRPPANVYSLFENTAGKIVEIALGPNADGSGSRTVQVVPIANESALRNRDWVEGNLKKVNKATDGRVAYVYVPNTGGAGHTYFKRYFYPQVNKDAVIIDERFNGGGSVADYYIDILRRPFIANWAMRYGADLKTPFASIQGPMAMIIDETAGSGGDLLPWMFRKYKMGPLVGQRTWGGLVGILGFPVLMDGGGITAPNLAIWTPEEGWIVENEGVPPDIDVEQTPADVIAGRDPQLEKAIEVVLAELKKTPPARATRPAYPVRGKTQRGTVRR